MKKLIPGLVISALAFGIAFLLKGGADSGPIVEKAPVWSHVLSVVLFSISAFLGFRYPIDGPNLNTDNVNAPTTLILVTLAVSFVVAVIAFMGFYIGNH